MTRTTRVGDYEVGGVVAHGLVGVIREATFVPSNQPVFLEEIPGEMAGDRAFIDRLSDVGRTASQLTSGNLLATHNVITDDSLSVVSQAAPGPSLAAVGPTLDAPATLSIAIDLLEGLTALHGAGLTHGSLSPATVWVDETSGAARLGEVAVAAATSKATTTDDLAAVTTLVDALVSRKAWPSSVAAILDQAPGRTKDPAYTTGDGLRAALLAAAERTWGAAWRPRTALAERARVAHGSPAMDLAAMASMTPATPPPAASTPVAEPAPPRRPSHKKRWIALAVVLIVLAGAATGVTLYLMDQHNKAVANAPLSLGNDLQVTAAPTSGGCNTTFGFAASASTSGKGTLSYEWVRSDGTPPVPQTVTITGDDSSFNLQTGWRLQGAQAAKATVTFKILAPVTRSASQTITYTCP